MKDPGKPLLLLLVLFCDQASYCYCDQGSHPAVLPLQQPPDHHNKDTRWKVGRPLDGGILCMCVTNKTIKDGDLAPVYLHNSYHGDS